MERNYNLGGEELKNLRDKLDKIVSEENAENWWKPKLFKQNTLSILPPELEIVEGVPDEKQNYNCFVYVLGLQNNPEIIGNNGWEFTRNLAVVFDDMIERGVLTKVETPKPGTIIIYRAQSGSISHVGLIEGDNMVISKWSWGPLLRHQIFAVPADYGDTVEFYNLTPEAIDYVLARRAGG